MFTAGGQLSHWTDCRVNLFKGTFVTRGIDFTGAAASDATARRSEHKETNTRTWLRLAVT